jgi:DNA polymerase III beta subunit, N-terminal domain
VTRLTRACWPNSCARINCISAPCTPLPILANVLLDTDGEAVRVTATDLEVGARVAVPARVAGKGAITVSARKLAEIVKERPAVDVALRVHDNAAVSLKCGTASYKLVGMAPDDLLGHFGGLDEAGGQGASHGAHSVLVFSDHYFHSEVARRHLTGAPLQVLTTALIANAPNCFPAPHDLGPCQ